MYFLVALSRMNGETEMDNLFSVLCASVCLDRPIIENSNSQKSILILFFPSHFQRFSMTMGLAWLLVIVRVHQERVRWAITSSSTSIGSVDRIDAAL
jgi:hypothetical protein